MDPKLSLYGLVRKMGLPSSTIFFLCPAARMRGRLSFCHATLLHMRKNAALYVRTGVFGIIDSLVSMVGVLAGLNVAGSSRYTLVLTAVIYAFVEAFSMSVGSFLSEESSEEYEHKSNVSERMPVIAGVIMFVSFVLVSFIPLAPYLLLSDPYALPASIGVSIAALFIGGAISGRVAGLPVAWRGFRMAALGGAAIALGVSIGILAPGAA